MIFCTFWSIISKLKFFKTKKKRLPDTLIKMLFVKFLNFLPKNDLVRLTEEKIAFLGTRNRKS